MIWLQSETELDSIRFTFDYDVYVDPDTRCRAFVLGEVRSVTDLLAELDDAGCRSYLQASRKDAMQAMLYALHEEYEVARG
jgi:hypothetical protein